MPLRNEVADDIGAFPVKLKTEVGISGSALLDAIEKTGKNLGETKRISTLGFKLGSVTKEETSAEISTEIPIKKTRFNKYSVLFKSPIIETDECYRSTYINVKLIKRGSKWLFLPSAALLISAVMAFIKVMPLAGALLLAFGCIAAFMTALEYERITFVENTNEDENLPEAEPYLIGFLNQIHQNLEQTASATP